MGADSLWVSGYTASQKGFSITNVPGGIRAPLIINGRGSQQPFVSGDK